MVVAVGHVRWALRNDAGLMNLSGRTLTGAEWAVKYGIRAEGDRDS